MSTTLYDPKTGTPVSVADEHVQTALSSGSLGVPSGDVEVLDPEGQLGTVPAEALPQALKDGYSLRTDEHRKESYLQSQYGNRPVAAALAGAARGPTFGLSDVALTQTGAMAPKALEQLSERNKGASAAGELAGIALLPNPAGALGEGVEGAALGEGTAAKSLARKFASSALSGGVEGSLYGVGNVISESALGDTDLNGEKLAAGAGLGALLGGGAGVLGKGVSVGVNAIGEGANAAMRGVTGQTLRESLQAIADKQTLKAAGFMGRDFKELAYKEAKGLMSEGEFAKVLRDNGVITPAASLDTVAERAATKADELGQKIGDIEKTLDQQARPGELVDANKLAARWESDILQPLQKKAALNPLEDADVAKIREFIDRAKAAPGGEIPYEQANALKRSLDSRLEFGAEQKPLQQQLKRMRGILGDEIQSAAERVDPDLAKQYGEARNLYGIMRETADVSRARAAGLQANRTISLTDYMAGGALGLLRGGPGGLVAGALGSVANKFAREAGPSIAAVGLDKLANSEFMSGVAKQFSTELMPKLESDPALFGPFRRILLAAAAKSPTELLGAHVQLARTDPAYRDTMALAGYPMESADEADVHAARGERLDAIRRRLGEHDDRIDAAVKRFLGKQGGAVPNVGEGPASRKEGLAEFEKQSKALDQIAQSPAALGEAIKPDQVLVDAAPATALSATATAKRAIDFLAANMPRSTDSNVLPALRAKWQPNETQLEQWREYVAAVNNPDVVLSQLRRGHVSPHAAAALKAVYPKLYSDVQQRMMEQVAGLDEGALSDRQKLSLSSLFGVPVGGAGRPDVVAIAQQFHAAAAKEHQQRQEEIQSQSQSKVNDKYATEQQRVAGR